MSRTPEQRAYDTFKKAADGRLLFYRIENARNGMSDLLVRNRFVAFWIELKAIEKWPARLTTFPLKSSFEKGQLPFLREWISWKGKGYVLLRVGQEYFLLDPTLKLAEMNYTQLQSVALHTRGSAADIVNWLVEVQ